MKIAFPLLNEKELAMDFIHSRYIGIYDDKEHKTDLIPLSGIEQKLGITVFFDTLTSQGLTSVVSPYYSYMSLRVFKEYEVETLKAMSNNLDENIKHLKEKALKPFNVYESLLIGDCAKDCNSCGTSCSSN